MAESLFTTQTPVGTDNFGGSAGVVTATSLTFAVTGTVTDIRFYATVTVGGVYTVALYQVTASDAGSAGTGTLLASKVMSGLPTPGTWNIVPFDTPVSVSPGILYRAVVHSTEGRYVNTASFFTAGLTNGNLTAPANLSNPVGLGELRQGTFKISTTLTYPTDGLNSNCHFVDVVFVASGTATIREYLGAVGVNTSVTLNTGVGTQVGDLLVAFQGIDFGDLINMNAPTGTAGTWTQEVTDILGNGRPHMKVWRRFVTSAGVQTVTVSGDASTGSSIRLHLYVIAGADLAIPIDASSGGGDAAAATSHQIPSVSPASSDALLIGGVSSEGGTNYTAPGSMSGRAELDSGFSAGMTAEEALLTSGPTGTRTFTSSGSTRYASASIAIKGADTSGGGDVSDSATVGDSATISVVLSHTDDLSVEDGASKFDLTDITSRPILVNIRGFSVVADVAPWSMDVRIGAVEVDL